MPQRMRPVDDVIKRVLHDRLFDPALVRVGYVDRLTDGGMAERALKDFFLVRSRPDAHSLYPYHI